MLFLIDLHLIFPGAKFAVRGALIDI